MHVQTCRIAIGFRWSRQIWQRRASSVGSVAAVAEAAIFYECFCSVGAVDARPSATRATEQRVVPMTLAGALPSVRPQFNGKRFFLSTFGVAQMVMIRTLRATAAARRVEDGGGARSVP
ncbi:hypothetical protein UC34_15355 [Pandoraea vervacti]|uniref:Uncharacterized protein n=1 Tax=Pandoraea vervacti TaxID=656178 RepID=A0ABM5SZN7_9BURK|nr:hypothetical protein UC34_15355 [Pandoraea vervacti]